MKTSTATKKISIATALAAISASTITISKAEAGIIQVTAPVPGPGFIDFSEVQYVLPDTPVPGININSIFFAQDTANPPFGVTFAERFVGQSLTYNGIFDVVSGIPTNPLALQIGLPNENLNVRELRKVLAGIGPQRFPNAGEGAIAMLFPRNQSELSFEVQADPSGSITLDFFRRDGSLIDTILLDNTNIWWLGDGEYAFQATAGDEIWGVSITNLDPDGIWIDNIAYNNPGPPAPPPQNVPEPPSILGLLALGALGGSLNLKRKLKR